MKGRQQAIQTKSLTSTLALAVLAMNLLCKGGLAQDMKAAPPPPELSVAPMAPQSIPGTAAGGDGQANVCHELVAFLQKSQGQEHGQASANPPTGTQNSTAVQSQSTEARQNTSGSRSDTQPAQAAPKVDKPQQQSGQSEPIPSGEKGFEPAPVTLQEAQAHAAKNDLRACRDAAQRMRRAGTTMPDSLIALAALRPDLLKPGKNAQ